MVKHYNQCLIIADGGHVRFVKPAEDNALHTIEAFDSATIHQRDRDLVSDRPGRSSESATSARHAYSPRVDPHDAEKMKFAHLVAERVCAESAAGLFNELVLVAPAHFLQELRASLDQVTEAKVIGTLAKDLTKVPDHELWPHVKEWVRPVHRA
ncbi:MAG: host attachment protein [Acetobacteraceae bacterium]